MKKEKVIKKILIFLLSCILIGCGNTTFNDKKNSYKQTISNEEDKENQKVDDNDLNKENITAGKNNVIESNNKNENILEDEKFFGTWTISKNLTTASQITTYDSNDINSIIGRAVSFSKDGATAFGESPKDLDNVIENPVYEKKTISKSEFEESWHTTFKDLSINKDYIIEVKVSSSNSQSTCDFLIKDDNTLIIYGGGVLLEMKKQV